MQVISHPLAVIYESLHKQLARWGEAGPQCSLPFSSPSSIQVLSSKQVLPECNLNWCSSWGIYLTTSDLEHKGHIHFNYLLCLRKLFRKSFHFCFFLKLWIPIEEYFLRTQYSSFKVPPRTDALCPHFPVSGSYSGPCCHHISPSSDLLMAGPTVIGIRLGERDDPRSLLLFPGSQVTGIWGTWCGPGSPEWGNSKKQHWAPPSAESALSFLGSLNQGVDTQASLLATHLRGREMYVFCT